MAGRVAGTPNKKKSFLLGRLKDLYGDDFHPIMKMAENAVALQKLAEQEQDVTALKSAVDAWDKVANYTEPKLKAVEVTGDVNHTIVKDLRGVVRK